MPDCEVLRLDRANSEAWCSPHLYDAYRQAVSGRKQSMGAVCLPRTAAAPKGATTEKPSSPTCPSPPGKTACAAVATSTETSQSVTPCQRPNQSEKPRALCAKGVQGRMKRQYFGVEIEAEPEVAIVAHPDRFQCAGDRIALIDTESPRSLPPSQTPTNPDFPGIVHATRGRDRGQCPRNVFSRALETATNLTLSRI
jgi:hypothetical protein